MTDAERTLRADIAAACVRMNAAGINQGTSGNVSVRWSHEGTEGMLITPSGLAYATMAPDDIVFVAADGTPTGPHKPSSEWRFHLAILNARSDLHAIVHAHPPFCTGVAITRQDVPAAHYMIAAVGGPTLRCARYETFGTDELSVAAVEAMEGRSACLLANHGLIAAGPNLPKAEWLAVECETLCRQWVIARQAGTPVILDDAEIDNCIERFKSYGPKSKTGNA